jgi:hypothetical protein
MPLGLPLWTDPIYSSAIEYQQAKPSYPCPLMGLLGCWDTVYVWRCINMMAQGYDSAEQALGRIRTRHHISHSFSSVNN